MDSDPSWAPWDIRPAILETGIGQVGGGEIFLARAPARLATVVAASLAVALFDGAIGLGGIANIVAPSGDFIFERPGRNADSAIPELVRRLMEAGADRNRLTAKLTGGARFIGALQEQPIILHRAAETEAAVRRALMKEGIELRAADMGGSVFRKVTFDLGSGILKIRFIDGMTKFV